MIKCKVGRLRWSDSLCLFHTRADFDVIIKEHNRLVDALDIAYKEINRLSDEIERLKVGECHSCDYNPNNWKESRK